MKGGELQGMGRLLTPSKAACPLRRRENYIKQTTPLLQDLLWDGMRVRLSISVFVQILSDRGDGDIWSLFARMHSCVDPVGPTARYVSPYPFFLPVDACEAQWAILRKEVVAEAGVGNPELQGRDEQFEGRVTQGPQSHNEPLARARRLQRWRHLSVRARCLSSGETHLETSDVLYEQALRLLPQPYKLGEYVFHKPNK